MSPPNELPSGWYAISVNYLYGKEEAYRQFLDMQPVAKIGFSIYIYHVA
ncbi:hypothetical protein FACS1894170_12960 [Planctomycetales bacterium]|nr:hypothetical protein FACS1894170_12960 [Planctomycetales bacterium]